MAWESPHVMGRDYVVIMCACTNVHWQIRHWKGICVFINNSHGGKPIGSETDWPYGTYMWLQLL